MRRMDKTSRADNTRDRPEAKLFDRFWFSLGERFPTLRSFGCTRRVGWTVDAGAPESVGNLSTQLRLLRKVSVFVFVLCWLHSPCASDGTRFQHKRVEDRRLSEKPWLHGKCFPFRLWLSRRPAHTALVTERTQSIKGSTLFLVSALSGLPVV